MHTCMHTYIHTYTYIHTNIHTYIVTRGHFLKLYEPKPRINIFKFTFSTALSWNKLPNYVCIDVSLCLNIF